MRHVILLDTKISATAFNQWKQEDTEFWEKHIGMTPQYWVIRTDFSDYPTYVDNDGDIRPTNSYLQSLNDMVVSKYRDFGTDFIMVMIHEDNWKSDNDQIKGIWGTNYSYVFGKQCLDYCRWDRDNSANTFGTAYHERHHSFDAIIKVETGVDVHPLLNVTRYDHEITHGNNPNWKYIRHKENTDSLKVMAPHLRKAFTLRQDRHNAELDKLRTIIALLEKLVYLYKMWRNQKDGMSRT